MSDSSHCKGPLVGFGELMHEQRSSAQYIALAIFLPLGAGAHLVYSAMPFETLMKIGVGAFLLVVLAFAAYVIRQPSKGLSIGALYHGRLGPLWSLIAFLGVDVSAIGIAEILHIKLTPTNHHAEFHLSLLLVGAALLVLPVAVVWRIGCAYVAKGEHEGVPEQSKHEKAVLFHVMSKLNIDKENKKTWRDLVELSGNDLLKELNTSNFETFLASLLWLQKESSKKAFGTTTKVLIYCTQEALDSFGGEAELRSLLDRSCEALSLQTALEFDIQGAPDDSTPKPNVFLDELREKISILEGENTILAHVTAGPRQLVFALLLATLDRDHTPIYLRPSTSESKTPILEKEYEFIPLQTSISDACEIVFSFGHIE